MGTMPSGPIGTLRESPLHAALKAYFAQPDDELEARVEGYWIDIRRPRPPHADQLIEIQTRNFSAMKAKVRDLSERFPLRIVHPIPAEKWLVRLDTDNRVVSRRKSPRRGHFGLIFAELVSFPEVFTRQNLTLEVVLTREEEIRKEQTPKRKRRWAKSYRSIERRLLDIVDWQIFEEPADLLSLLPPGLPAAFTNRELADTWDKPIWLAQRATYCLTAMGVLAKTTKRGNAFVFERSAV